MAWATFTVDVTQDSNQVVVYGAVPASELPAGFELIINGISNLEVSYGTAVMYDGSNNPYSHLYLVRPYTGTTAASLEMVVKPTGSQFNDVVSIFQNASMLLNSTLQNYYQFVEGDSEVEFQPLDENAEPISIKPLLQMNEEAQTAVSEAISVFQNAAGTAADYDVTESSTDRGNGENGQPKLLKVGDNGINTTIKKYVKVINVLENSSREIGRLSINKRSAAQLKVTVIPRSGAGIGNQISITNLYSVQRSDSSSSVVELISVNHESTNGAAPNILNPNVDGETIILGVSAGNNGTGTSYNYTCIVEVLSSFLTSDFIFADDGVAFTAVSTYPRGLRYEGKPIFHTGNIVGVVSQSDGVPTGSIIERGSNANGNYVKLADGTMICWYRSPEQNAVAPSVAFGFSWTFPSSFVDIAYVNCSANVTSGGNDNPPLVSSSVREYPDGTSAILSARNNSAVNLNIRLIGQAIGRWY